jgi:hypothetical protein
LVKKDVFSSNLTHLKRTHPQLFTKLTRTGIDKSSSPPETPSSPYIQIDRDMFRTKSDILVVFGFGSGDHVQQVLDASSEHTSLLVVEPDIKRFESALRAKDLQRVLSSPRITFVVGEDPLRVRGRIIRFYNGMITRPFIQMVESEHLHRLNPTYYDQLKCVLKDLYLESFQNLSTLRDRAPLWQKNIFANLRQIVLNPGVGVLFGRFKEVPTIIVSAGPSLDKNVSEIEGRESEFLIITVDTALKTLLNHNIQPHIIVSIGGEEENYRYYLKDNKARKVCLVADAVVFPETFHEFSGPVFITNDGHPMINWLRRFLRFTSFTAKGGSVATTALSLSIQMGCNPVIFIGQDLSYPAGKTHTQGVPRGKRQREIIRQLKRDHLIWIEGQNGGRVPTSPTLYNVLRWFEAAISGAKNRTYINATEGGAKIKGTKVLTLKEAIVRYGGRQFNFEKEILAIYKSHLPPNTRPLCDELERLIKAWGIVKALADDGIRLAKAMRGERNKARQKGVLHRLKIIQKEIFSDIRFSYPASWSTEWMLHQLQGQDESVASFEEFFKKIWQIAHSGVYQMEEAKKDLEKDIVNQVACEEEKT